jgi:hypothetical protein
LKSGNQALLALARAPAKKEAVGGQSTSRQTRMLVLAQRETLIPALQNRARAPTRKKATSPIEKFAIESMPAK